jgi:hypothetical protein
MGEPATQHRAIRKLKFHGPGSKMFVEAAAFGRLKMQG